MALGRPSVAEAEDSEIRRLEAAIAERRCRKQTGFGTFAEVAAEFRSHPRCPSCGSARAKRDGLAPNDARGWECLGCGRKHGSLAGTAFEHTRRGLPGRVSLIGLMRFSVPLDCIGGRHRRLQNPCAVACGHGKPSHEEDKGVFGGHVAKGATIARDRRRACNGLVRDAGAVSEPHKSDVRDPEYWEKMARPSTTSAHGPRDVSGASRGCPWAVCRAISTGASIPFASTKQVTDGPKLLHSQRLMTWREDRSPDARTRPSAWG